MSVESILQAMAENAGRREFQRGSLLGNTIQNLSQVPAQYMADRDATAERLRRQAIHDEQLGFQRNADTRATNDQRLQEEAARREVENKAALAQAIQVGFGDSDDPKDFNEAASVKWLKENNKAHLMQAVMEAHKAFKKETPKTREVKIENPDGTSTIKIVEDKPGFIATSTPKPAETKLHPVTVPGLKGAATVRMFTEDELKGGVQAYREPKASKDDNKFWIFRDGKPLRITEAEYKPGDLPSNTREQGRPVTSGDAGRISEVDNALDDIKRLTTTIGGVGATGTLSKIGAKLPNAVTDLTGLGTEAKQKQALIDRVKQVIGKTLEGGVLRKEDELKYEKILPTIADPSAVVKTKLEGLDTAIRQRRERLLESLTNAGYDTGKFERTEKSKPTAQELIDKYSKTR